MGRDITQDIAGASAGDARGDVRQLRDRPGAAALHHHELVVLRRIVFRLVVPDPDDPSGARTTFSDEVLVKVALGKPAIVVTEP